MRKKRSAGEGTIKHLKGGRWVCTIMAGRSDDGRVRYDKIYGDTRAELSHNIYEYHQKKREKYTCDMAFRAHAQQWYSRHKRNLRTASQSSYPHVLKKLMRYWGETPINVIKASHVHDMMIYFENQGLSPSYQRKLRGMLHQVLEAAVADDLLVKNPVTAVKFKISDSSSPREAYTADEIQLVCHQPPSKIRDASLILIGHGLRIGEFLALRGTDCDRHGTYLSISKAVNMTGGTPVIGATKNVSSVRKIPVPSPLQPLVAHYATYGDRYLWESPQHPNRPINPSSFRSAFTRFCSATQIRTLTPHCCRHTYASLLYAQGAHMLTVKRLMGHTDSDITEHYTHSTWEDLAQATRLLDIYFKDISFDFS